jgi:hypothetical protein
METTKKDFRTQIDIHNQAKALFKNVYTQITGNKTSDNFMPFAMDYKTYQQVKRECLTIAIRYEDHRLEEEIKRNFTNADNIR